MRPGRDVYDIAPRAGLAARQMHLQDAKLGRLAEDPQPGQELVLSRVEGEGMRAIRTAERTTMRQLGEEPKKLVQDCGTR
jgi:hypothetical protein